MPGTITHVFDKSLVIYRLKKTSGNKTSFQSTATVEGALQNKVIEMKTNMGVVTSRNWMTYLDITTDIKNGDQVIYNGTKFYVDEVTRRDYGINQHLEVLLKEANE